jgi:hypothetical protein
MTCSVSSGSYTGFLLTEAGSVAAFLAISGVFS